LPGSKERERKSCFLIIKYARECFIIKSSSPDNNRRERRHKFRRIKTTALQMNLFPKGCRPPAVWRCANFFAICSRRRTLKWKSFACLPFHFRRFIYGPFNHRLVLQAPRLQSCCIFYQRNWFNSLGSTKLIRRESPSISTRSNIQLFLEMSKA